MFHQLLPDELVQAGGWTILHSLWQGAIITLLLAFLLGRTRQQPPALRYQLSVSALFLFMGTVLFTFFQYYEPASGPSRIYNVDTGPSFSAYHLLSAPVETANPEFFSQIFPFLLQVWMVGVALMGLRMLGELAYLQRLRFSNTRSVPENWNKRLRALSLHLGIRQQVDLKESMRVGSPMLVGWIKPVILLPVGMLSGLSLQQVECVLAHELAHVRRMDYVVNLIQSAVEVFLFFNPAVWWISAQIREEREHCCDELAVGLTGDRLTLVKTLAQLEEWRLHSGQLGLAFNGRPQGILGRVQRLLGGESSVRIIGKGLWSLLFFSLATGLLAFHDQAGTAADRYWENVGLLSAEVVNPSGESMGELATIVSTPTNSVALAKVEKKPEIPENFRKSAVDFTSRLIQSLPARNFGPISSLRDTVPDEKWELEMRALHEQMNALHEEMMKSQEMKQIQELTKTYQKEMQVVQEKMMKDNGVYEKMRAEQQKAMEKLERKHQELMQGESFKAMQEESEKLAAEFHRQVEVFRQQYENKPLVLEQKMDSLSRIFDGKQDAFEKKFEGAMKAFEMEMEALEDTPEMKAIEANMEAIQEQIEQQMESQIKPMEEEMEKLQKVMEEKFEQQMKVLEDKMEKLERQRSKQEGRREE